jgi:hypothetical protein
MSNMMRSTLLAAAAALALSLATVQAAPIPVGGAILPADDLRIEVRSSGKGKAFRRSASRAKSAARPRGSRRSRTLVIAPTVVLPASGAAAATSRERPARATPAAARGASNSMCGGLVDETVLCVPCSGDEVFQAFKCVGGRAQAQSRCRLAADDPLCVKE